jgi:hypothetical protein
MRRLSIALLGLVACRGPAERPAPGASCAPAADTIRIALFEPVDTAVPPRARNDGERLVFGHLDQVSIRPGCGRPALEVDSGRVMVLRPGRRVLEFRWWPGGDARDLLESRADAVVTDQHAAIEYAAARPDLEALPMPWSRVYALVVPAGMRSLVPVGSWRDAVRGEARPPSWPLCLSMGAGPDRPAVPRSQVRLVYRQGSEHARQLAERFVARWTAPDLRPRSVALDPAALGAAVGAGRDFAVVALAWVASPARPDRT